ncbi:MAG: hypothetical protein ACLQVI_24150 [Polyangiaceae bacterium]|jgi:hypothetical protein
MNLTFRQLLLFTPILVGALAQTACPSPDERSESIDPTTLPQEVRADYELFAQRCSKCHSLSRPLNSGIVDDDYWSMYVARMRRQPGSGISVDDSRVILRFLHFYSQEQIRKKQARAASASEAPPVVIDAATGQGDAG